MKEKYKMIIMGHRGANSIAPENTLKAFQKAIELGADYVEFDVYESKDGELVIMHDEDTLRTTGQKGLIKNMSLKELKALDCGEGEQIPTLQELINLAKGKIGLNCEVKAEGIVNKIIKVFREADIIDSTMISSFLHDELLKAQKIEPKLRIASLEPTGEGGPIDWARKKTMLQFVIKNNFFAINPLYTLVNQKFVDLAKQGGVKVFPWTVDSKIGMKKLIKMGVDGIITNDISRAKELINH
ncbi:MAG: glycerophosphodiester phosphodiesterase [Promethearchaeota archaeon]